MSKRKDSSAKQGASLPKRLPPGKATWAKNAQVVITADTKVTICPGYRPRFEAIALPGNMSVQKGRVSA